MKVETQTTVQGTVQRQAKQLIVGLMAMGALLGLGAEASAQGAAGSLKIGFIDMQRAIQETSTGKKAKKDLEKEFNSKKAELQKKEEEIKKMNEDLEKKRVALSDEARSRKMQELSQEMAKFQREVTESQMNLQRREQSLTKPIVDKLQEAIDRIAKDQGFTMILEKGQQPTVIWAKKEVDLTDEVVKAYEKMVK
jgi:outer membrane protein